MAVVEEMFHACKKGDLHKLIHLVETKEVDTNVRDKWDSTPLYYGCLCGHKEVVEFLLEKGAKCQANTFEGERCLYGALTDEIRNMLRKHRIVSSRVKRRSSYEEFLRRLHESMSYFDITFNIHGEKIQAHRCVLSTRCEFFANMFITRWYNRDQIDLNHISMSAGAFRCILQFLYTGCMEIPLDLVDDCIRLAKHIHLETLVKSIEIKLKKTLTWESTKLGVRITTLMIDPSDGVNEQLKKDMGLLVERSLPIKFTTWVEGELPFEQMRTTYPDMCFIVEGQSFMCHKAFFCTRSDYFKALLEDHFHESDSTGEIQVISLNVISLEVFLRIHSYLYTESCDLPQEIITDVLIAADMMLLTGLKSLCASAFLLYINRNNVVALIKTSRLFHLPRLEAYCAEFIAEYLTQMVTQEDFIQLVYEDAHAVKDRQETDSIDIIDDTRYYITNFVRTYSEMAEANDKLKLIDDLLEKLGIEG